MRTVVSRVALNTAFGVPVFARWHARRALTRGYDQRKDDVGYVDEVFADHSSHLRSAGVDWVDKDVLEIGPGGNLGVCVRFLQNGARSATAIDIVPWSTQVNPEFYERLGARGVLNSIRYLAPHDVHQSSLAAESFDVIFSHAVLEHVRDPAVVAAQGARMTRPGGAVSHRIDLRDHGDFSRPREFLKYSDLTWRLMTSNLPWRTNRWRADDHRTAIESSGMQVLVDDREPAPRTQIRLNRRFIGRSDIDVIGQFIVAIKTGPTTP